MIILNALNFMFEKWKNIFEIGFCRFCSLGHFKLLLEIVDAPNSLEIIDETDKSVFMFFLGEIVLFEKIVHFFGDAQYNWSCTNFDILVDESGDWVEVVVELLVGRKNLLFEQFLNVSTFALTILNYTLKISKEFSILFVLLDCLGRMGEWYSQLFDFLFKSLYFTL